MQSILSSHLLNISEVAFTRKYFEIDCNQSKIVDIKSIFLLNNYEKVVKVSKWVTLSLSLKKIVFLLHVQCNLYNLQFKNFAKKK